MRLGSPPWVHSLGALFALAAALSTGRARADESGVSVQVVCPELAEEQRAALESRANAELLVRRQKGTLFVACRPGAVHIRWQPAEGDAAEHDISLPADAIATEEQVLEALELLLRPPEPRESAPAAQTPERDRAPPKTRPPEPLPTPPLPLRRIEPDGDAGRPPFFELLAGAALELWSSQVTGALGPRARVLWVLPRGWALSGGAAVAWTLRAPGDVTGRAVRTHAGGQYHVDRDRRLRIGASALLDLLHAARETSSATDADNETVFGGMLEVQYVLFGPPLQMALGPTISARAGAVRVEIGDREIFHIPAVALGWSVELVLGPL